MAQESAWITTPICRDNSEIFRVCISYPITGNKEIDSFYQKLCETYYGYLVSCSENGAPPGGSARLLFETHWESDSLFSAAADVICYEGGTLTDWRRIAHTWLLPRGSMLSPAQFGISRRRCSGFYLTEEGIVCFHNRFNPTLVSQMRRSQYPLLVECDAPIPLSADLPRKPPKLLPRRNAK